ncbi:MAG: hypothetical protein ACTSPI_05380 [Candidatus Heimdallarchaeaceae archaeon]
MKNRMILMPMIIVILLVFPTLPANPIYAEDDTNFRKISFNHQGYDLRYTIVEGSNINSMFSFLGFNLSGSLANSEFHVVLKNKFYDIRDIYYIESDKIIPENTSLFSMESYFIFGTSLSIEIIETEIPTNSSIFVPNIFTPLTRPNFAALVKDMNIFDFLPIILGTDYNRYEAEFTTLALNGDYSVNIFNQGYDEFTIALKSTTNSSFSIKVSWNKETGVLSSFSLHISVNNKSNIFSIQYEDYTIINSPVQESNISFLITNSYAFNTFYYGRDTIKNNLNEKCSFINQLNNTEALFYEIYGIEGLDFALNWSVLNPESGEYEINTPLHSTVLALIQPLILPIWRMNEGIIDFVSVLWNQIDEKFKDYKLILSNKTTYYISNSNLVLQKQKKDNVYYVLSSYQIRFQRNETNILAQRVEAQSWDLNISLWLAYSSGGQLVGFSTKYSELYHYFFDPPSSDINREIKYYWEYLIESIPSNISIPTFTTDVQQSPFIFFFESLLILNGIMFVTRKKRKQYNRGNYK